MFETLAWITVVGSLFFISYILFRMLIEESKPMPHEKK